VTGDRALVFCREAIRFVCLAAVAQSCGGAITATTPLICRLVTRLCYPRGRVVAIDLEPGDA
jgi:hypothetical protein